MIFTELKPQLERLSARERIKALAYLKHLGQVENPKYKRELARRNAEMDAGRKITLTEARRRLRSD